MGNAFSFGNKQQPPQPVQLADQGRAVNLNTPLSPGLSLGWTPPPRYGTAGANQAPYKQFYASMKAYLTDEAQRPPNVIWLESQVPPGARRVYDEWARGDRLGSGGFGAVYETWPKEADEEPQVKQHVLKEVSKMGMFQRERNMFKQYTKAQRPDDAQAVLQDAADKLFALRFEVEVLYKVSRAQSRRHHLELTAVYEDDSRVYIVTPKAQGGVLGKKIDDYLISSKQWELYDEAMEAKPAARTERHKAHIKEVQDKQAARQQHGARWCHEMMFALFKLHDEEYGMGIMHRDIKPDNLMLTADNHVMIIDFGLARKGPTALNDGAYTPFYHAPEQPNGDAVSTAADVFSMGKVFEQLLSKHGRPVTTKTLGNLIAAMLVRDPKKRPTAKQILLATPQNKFDGKDISFFPPLTAAQLAGATLPDGLDYTGALRLFDRGYESDEGAARGGDLEEEEGSRGSARLRRARRQNAELRKTRRELRDQLATVLALVDDARRLLP